MPTWVSLEHDRYLSQAIVMGRLSEELSGKELTVIVRTAWSVALIRWARCYVYEDHVSVSHRERSRRKPVLDRGRQSQRGRDVMFHHKYIRWCPDRTRREQCRFAAVRKDLLSDQEPPLPVQASARDLVYEISSQGPAPYQQGISVTSGIHEQYERRYSTSWQRPP